MGYANLAKTVLVGQVGHGVHLPRGHIARWLAMRLEGNEDRPIARHLVGHGVVAEPGAKIGVSKLLCIQLRIGGWQGFVGMLLEEPADTVNFGLIQHQAIAYGSPFGLHHGGEFFRPGFLDQDFDAGLVLVVAAAMAVVHAQDGLEIGQQVLLFQEGPNHHANDRRAPQTTAHQHFKAGFSVFVFNQLQADVMHLGSGPVALRAADGDLELARQEGEFRVQRRPLPDDFTVGPGIFQLVHRHAGQMVAGRVAYAVAAGLDGMHLHTGQVVQNIRHLLELGPVVLDILPRREMPVILVVGSGDMPQHPQLSGRQQAIRDGDAQHRRMALNIEAVHQPQGSILILRQFAGKKAAGLFPELGRALVDQRLVVLIVLVHVLRRGGWLAGPSMT